MALPNTKKEIMIERLIIIIHPQTPTVKFLAWAKKAMLICNVEGYMMLVLLVDLKEFARIATTFTKRMKS